MPSNKKISDQKNITIFIVEDHPIFRKGLVQLINNEDGFEVCGEADNYLDGLNNIKKIKPDLVIADITLKNSSGIDLIKDIKLFMPNTIILALSMHDENIYAERLLRAGAKGYLMKHEAPEIIIKAIHQILDGKIYVSEHMASKILSQVVEGRNTIQNSSIDILSDRELEVYKLIGNGHSTRQISENLHVSIKTVENHKAHIKEKLNLKNSIELIQHATLWIQDNQK